MIRAGLPLALVVFVLAVGLGCGGKDEGKSNKEPRRRDNLVGVSAAPASGGAGGGASAEARTLYDSRCAMCHGATGRGDGSAAASLAIKPRNYGDQGWQGAVTDQQIRDAIVKGGPGIGKSPLMVANPDLGAPDKAAVLDGLVQLIRGFAR